MVSSTQDEIRSARSTTRVRNKRNQAAAGAAAASLDAVSAEPILTGTSLMVRPFDINARDQMVAEAAYYRAQRRGFEPGHELEDWLASEADIDAYLYRLYGEGRSF